MCVCFPEDVYSGVQHVLSVSGANEACSGGVIECLHVQACKDFERTSRYACAKCIFCTLVLLLYTLNVQILTSKKKEDVSAYLQHSVSHESHESHG